MGTWWLGEMTTLWPAHHKDLPALDHPSSFLLIVGRGMATLLAHPTMSIKMSRTTMVFWPRTIVNNGGAGINGFFPQVSAFASMART